MCGIVYVKKLDGSGAAKLGIKRYHKQSSRGRQGFGYVPIEDGYVRRVERFKDEESFLTSLKKETASEILIHHRAPTSTENMIGTTHPVVVSDPFFEYNYYLVHNGVLTNEHVLKHEHSKLGLEYVTAYEKSTLIKFRDSHEEISTKMTGFLDSEALAKEVALFIEGHKKSIDTKGGVAFFCIQTDKEGKVIAHYYGRNEDRPLIAEAVLSKKARKKHGDYLSLKSEGGGVSIAANKLFRIDYATGDATFIDANIGQVNEYATRRIGFNQPINRTQLLPPPSTPKESRSRLLDDFFKPSDKMTPDRIKLSSLASLESRGDAIQEELIDYDTDKKMWYKMIDDSISQKDTDIAWNEIEVINDITKGLRLELNNVENELTNRYSQEDTDDAVESPYQNIIRTIR